jgi:hypothetical protein
VAPIYQMLQVGQNIGMSQLVIRECQRLPELMRAQIEIAKKHLDEHKYLRRMQDRNEALGSFIADYGWLIREIHCTKVCDLRNSCSIAAELSASGDLLRKRPQ